MQWRASTLLHSLPSFSYLLIKSQSNRITHVSDYYVPIALCSLA
jgi:hypothetical protein